MIVRAGVDALAKVGEEVADPVGDGVVPFDLAGPAAFSGILGELLFTVELGPQARCVLTGGEELRTTEVEVALAAALDIRTCARCEPAASPPSSTPPAR